MSELWFTLASWNWSAIIAGLALAVGVGNTSWNIRQAKNKPVDERRASRDEVRVGLKTVMNVSQPLIQVLRKGEIPSGSEPLEMLAEAHSQMVAITKDGLKVPHSSYVQKPMAMVGYIDLKWKNAQVAESAKRFLPMQGERESIDRVSRTRAVALMELLDALKQLVGRADRLLNDLSRIDDGDRDAIKEWRTPRTSV